MVHPHRQALALVAYGHPARAGRGRPWADLGRGRPEPVGAGRPPAAAQPHRAGGARPVPADRGDVPGRAAVREVRGAREPVPAQPERPHGGQREGGPGDAAGRRDPAPGRDPDRADLGPGPLLPRRGQRGPRRRRPAAVRRAELAAGRDRLGRPVLHRGHRGRAVRGLLRRHGRRAAVPLMDIIWAFPVYLLAISLSTELLTHSNGFQFGPVHVSASSLWTPTVIIAVIYVPYVYRPIRGQVLSVVNKEFVEASIAQGAGEPAADLLGDPAQRGVHRDRAAPADGGHHDPDRVRAVLPRPSASSRRTSAGERSSRTARACCTPGHGSRSHPGS